jgi:predicted AlkP superfamily pyrophosphatase or phosphodiesterase
VNLMSTLAESMGARPRHKQLKILPASEIRRAKNTVLIVIDGMGYEYILKHRKGGFLYKNLRGKVMSTMPSTTAAAITTYHTGLATNEHAQTGWFMYLKEIGAVAKLLPFAIRYGNHYIDPDLSKIFFPYGNVYQKIKAKSCIVMPRTLVESVYTDAHTANARKLGYDNLDGFVKKIRRAIAGSGRKYVYAYWPLFDSLAHNYGTESRVTLRHFKEIENALYVLSCKLQKTDTNLIITADHGFIDTEGSKVLWVEDHRVLQDCLTLPLCGETRLAYCYVKPSMKRIFESYVRKKLNKYCSLYTSRQLINKGFFGLGKSSKNLIDRIGDYTIIMKENYIIRDRVLGERRYYHKGNHGGISKEEIYVPLVFIKSTS